MLEGVGNLLGVETTGRCKHWFGKAVRQAAFVQVLI